MAVMKPGMAGDALGRKPSGWLVIAVLVGVVVGAAIGLQPVWQWLHGQWGNIYSIYSHGYLTAAMSAWMAWRAWQVAPPARLAPDWRAGVVLAGLSGLLIVAAMLDIDGSRALLVPPVIVASAWLLLGWSAAWRLLPAAAFLYLAIAPFWLLERPLQWLAATVVGAVVSVSGITAYIEGEFIHIPAGIFEIAGACSGVSYFTAGLTLASFYALMYLRGWRSRLALVAIAGFVAIASNWIRIYTLVLIGHFSDMQHSLVDDHYTYGWILFLVVFAPVLFLARHLEDREQAQAPEASVPPAAEQVGGAGPRPRLTGSVPAWLGAGALAAAILLLPAIASAWQGEPVWDFWTGR